MWFSEASKHDILGLGCVWWWRVFSVNFTKGFFNVMLIGHYFQLVVSHGGLFPTMGSGSMTKLDRSLVNTVSIWFGQAKRFSEDGSRPRLTWGLNRSCNCILSVSELEKLNVAVYAASWMLVYMLPKCVEGYFFLFETCCVSGMDVVMTFPHLSIFLNRLCRARISL